MTELLQVGAYRAAAQNDVVVEDQTRQALSDARRVWDHERFYVARRRVFVGELHHSSGSLSINMPAIVFQHIPLNVERDNAALVGP